MCYRSIRGEIKGIAKRDCVWNTAPRWEKKSWLITIASEEIGKPSKVPASMTWRKNACCSTECQSDMPARCWRECNALKHECFCILFQCPVVQQREESIRNRGSRVINSSQGMKAWSSFGITALQAEIQSPFKLPCMYQYTGYLQICLRTHFLGISLCKLIIPFPNPLKIHMKAI